MSHKQEDFDRVMFKIKDALEDEDTELSLGALMNVMIVKAMNELENVCEAYYAIDQLKHEYFAELSRLILKEKKQSQ